MLYDLLSWGSCWTNTKPSHNQTWHVVMLGRVESCGVNMLNCLIVTVDNLRWQYIFNIRKKKINPVSWPVWLVNVGGWKAICHKSIWWMVFIGHNHLHGLFLSKDNRKMESTSDKMRPQIWLWWVVMWYESLHFLDITGDSLCLWTWNCISKI